MNKILALAVITLTACAPLPQLTPAVQEELDHHCFPKLEDTGQKIDLCPAARAWLEQVWDQQHPG